MYYIEEVTWVKSASEESYTINSESRRELEGIMDRIYREDPSYWPDGLDISGHDDIYMVREASTNEPAGFVGWQAFPDGNGKTVGLYTIGILPEHRRKGFAKEAVSKILSKKANEVDYVRAYIAAHNDPSLKLADKLNVPVIKAASVPAGAQEVVKKVPTGRLLTGMGIGGVGNAAFWDWQNTPEADYPFQGHWDKHRAGQFGLNALLGGLGGGELVKNNLLTGLGSIAMTPAKDALMAGIPVIKQLPDKLSELDNELSTLEKSIMYGSGGLGLLAALVGGSRALKHMRDRNRLSAETEQGKIKVTLPTRDPDDHETVLEMPFQELTLPQYQKDRLRRDLRRRIYKETKERTRERKTPRREKENPRAGSGKYTKPGTPGARPNEPLINKVENKEKDDKEDKKKETTQDEDWFHLKQSSINKLSYILDQIYG